MLTKKENLLIRPWLVQRFNSHKKKVKSAGPAIDFRSPKIRPHVTLKHKKKQKELERKKEIEQENLRLVQKLSVIMNTLRLDNYWKDPRPNFLGRQCIYQPKPSSSKTTTPSISPEQPISTLLTGSRCSACNGGKRNLPKPRSNKVSPEARIPWATPKTNWNRTLDFDPVVHRCCRYCCC